MKTSFKFLAVLVAVLSFISAAFAAEASPDGTWKWTVQGRQGAQGFDQTLKLDYKNGKLTGTMAGRQGGQFSVPDTEIQNASLQNGIIKFSITREFNGRSFTTSYEGKLEDDTIKGTFERPGMNDAAPVKSEWLASRQK